MSLIDEAREIKDWINSDDPCNTGDLELNIVEQMCNHILAKPKRSKKTAGVWQITEERVRAIQWASEMAGDCKAGDALKAMLEEAGQE